MGATPISPGPSAEGYLKLQIDETTEEVGVVATSFGGLVQAWNPGRRETTCTSMGNIRWQYNRTYV